MTPRPLPALLALASTLAACGPLPADRPDAGRPHGADAGEEVPDAGPPPDPVCTSDTYWTRGNHGDAAMNPGQACIACHADDARAPRFRVAGTLYPTSREPSGCNGHDGTLDDAVIEVTSATGTRKTLAVNEAGNFFLESALTFPLTVRVTQGGRERRMMAQVTSGDCNACHTMDGLNGAPGRIRLPDPE